jgi:hypothetical protein
MGHEVGPAALPDAVEPERKQRCRFDFESEVRNHILHQWLINQGSLKGAAACRVMNGFRKGPSHPARGADGKIEPRQMRHRKRRLDALPLLADEPAERTARLG